MKLLAAALAPLAAAGLVISSPALAADHGHAHGGSAPSGKATAAAGASDAKDAQVVNLTVTSDGFVPDKVSVKAGKPVKLVVTRKVERTCATDIVMKDFGVNQPLPLEKAVTVTITPKKAGQYRFACAHGHIAGTLQVN
jgi:plastocyanin domain-containing protein